MFKSESRTTSHADYGNHDILAHAVQQTFFNTNKEIQTLANRITDALGIDRMRAHCGGSRNTRRLMGKYFFEERRVQLYPSWASVGVLIHEIAHGVAGYEAKHGFFFLKAERDVFDAYINLNEIELKNRTEQRAANAERDEIADVWFEDLLKIARANGNRLLIAYFRTTDRENGYSDLLGDGRSAALEAITQRLKRKGVLVG